MANEKKNEQYNEKEFIAKYLEDGKIIDTTKRKKVKMTSDIGAWKDGHVIEPHELKAKYLIDKGFAKEVK